MKKYTLPDVAAVRVAMEDESEGHPGDRYHTLLQELPIPEKYLVQSPGTWHDDQDSLASGSPTSRSGSGSGEEDIKMSADSRRLSCPYERERRRMFGTLPIGIIE